MRTTAPRQVIGRVSATTTNPYRGLGTTCDSWTRSTMRCLSLCSATSRQGLDFLEAGKGCQRPRSCIHCSHHPGTARRTRACRSQLKIRAAGSPRHDSLGPAQATTFRHTSQATGEWLQDLHQWPYCLIVYPIDTEQMALLSLKEVKITTFGISRKRQGANVS